MAVLCNPLGGGTRNRIATVRRIGHDLAGDSYCEAVTAAEIAQALHSIDFEDRRILCIIGGDGTVQAVLTSLASRGPEKDWPVLAVMPGGTTNMTAADLGAAGPLMKSLNTLLRRQRNGSIGDMIVRRAVLRIERGDDQTICGMFFGLGAVSKGVRFFRHHLSGRQLYLGHTSVMAAARVLGSVALGGRARKRMAQEVAWTVDGRPVEHGSGLLCVVSTLNHLVLGTTPYWGNEEEPIHFTVVEAGARGLLMRLPRLAMGRPGRSLTADRGYHSRNGRCIEVDVTGPFVVDGEVFSSPASEGPLRITPIRDVDWLVS